MGRGRQGQRLQPAHTAAASLEPGLNTIRNEHVPHMRIPLVRRRDRKTCWQVLDGGAEVMVRNLSICQSTSEHQSRPVLPEELHLRKSARVCCVGWKKALRRTGGLEAGKTRLEEQRQAQPGDIQ